MMVDQVADLSRSLEERTKELDGLRRQLAREEAEKHELFAQINSLIGEMAQLKTPNATDGREILALSKELDELKADFARKQGELQRTMEELNKQREDAQRRERMMELKRQRMSEELKERDELLRELTETGDELGRALNEANNDLQSAREQLVLAQQHKNGGEDSQSNSSHQLEQFQAELAKLAAQLEMAERKAGQTEIVAAENAEQLKQRTSELQQANKATIVERKRADHLAQRIVELEPRIGQMEMSNAELTKEFDEAKSMLRNERQKHEKELAELEERGRKKLVAMEQQISDAKNRETLVEDADQMKNDQKLFELEAENGRLKAELEAEQKRWELAEEKNRIELDRIREKATAEADKQSQQEMDEIKQKLTHLESEAVRLSAALLSEERRRVTALVNAKTQHEEEMAEAKTEMDKTIGRMKNEMEAEFSGKNQREMTKLREEIVAQKERELADQKAWHMAKLEEAMRGMEKKYGEEAEANKNAAEGSVSDLRAKLNKMENTGMSAELLAEQQRADRERHKWEAELEAIRRELVEAKRELTEAKTPLAGQSPEPPATPTAKPRKSTMGSGSSPIGSMEVAKNNGNGQMKGERMVAKLEAELDKQKRLVTVLRKKLQQQQLEAMKREREATKSTSDGGQNGL